MSQIIISINKQITKRIKLVKPVYTIGRDRKCDIVLPERTISNHHAKLVNSGEDCFLEDTDSTNGIYVNHRAIRRYLLIDNDIIHIGKYQLTFRSTAGLVTQLRQLSIHPRFRNNSDIPWLEITSGARQGNIIPLERDKITLGEQGIGTLSIERNAQGEYMLHGTGGELEEVIKLEDNDNFMIGDTELVFRTC
jgi:pSer/pThr/pTyr-binding forkhead associated (FHA) protein